MQLGKLHKTQRAIRKVFLNLLNVKSFNQITVTDIIKEAELGRTTFYSYYTDKFQLLEEIEQELIGGFIHIMLEFRKSSRASFDKYLNEGLVPAYVEYFKYIKKYNYEFKTLLNYKSETHFSDKFTAAITATRNETVRIWRKQLGKTEITDLTLSCYRESVFSSVYVSLFTTWLKRDMDLSEEQMGRLLTSIWSSTALYTNV